MVKTGAEARRKILRGVKAIYEPTRLTLGPESGSALMYRTYARGPRIVDDGNTIASVIEPKDEFERLVAQAFRETAAETNKRAGDGTTTTMVIAGKLVIGILSRLEESSASYAGSGKLSVRKVCRALLALSKEIQEKVKARSKKIETLEELEKISMVSLGNEEVGKVVAKVVWDVGVDGFVDVVDGYKGELETEVIHGCRFAAKPGAKAFINNPKRFEMLIEDCPVLLTNYKIDNAEQAKAAFGKLLEKNNKIAVLAPDFSDQVLISMVQTSKQGFFMFPVKVPSLRTEQFEDLAIYFDAKFIDKNLGMKLENADDACLGFVEKLVVKDTENREDAVALGGRGSVEKRMKTADKEYSETSPLAERIKVLKAQIVEERIDSHKKLLERRIASLASAVGVIRVGASTTAESLPLKLKIEDAQYACKSALEEGYVQGGGLCLQEIAAGMDFEEGDETGACLIEALQAPYKQIQENNEGTLEIGPDIIDPTKVVRMAVEHALSVAANLITVKIIIPEERERDAFEGQALMAQAMRMFAALFAKREGIKAENAFEMEADMMRIAEENEGKD